MKLSIQNHLALNSTTQQQNEKIAAQKASEKAARNLTELNRTIPNLAEFLANHNVINHSFFVTEDNQPNILSKSAGILLYPANVSQYLSEQVSSFLSASPDSPFYDSASKSCLVILGVGLGLHLQTLIEALTPSYVIIYEPEDDFLKLSLYTAPWFELLTFCSLKHIQVFIQHGKDSQDVIADLAELKQAVPALTQIAYYRHFSYPHIDKQLAELSIIPATIANDDLHPYLLPLTDTSTERRSIASDKERWQRLNENVVFFKAAYPELFAQLQPHAPHKIADLPAKTFCHNENLTFSSSSCALEDEAVLILKDPLVYGLTLSKKLNDIAFLHFINKLTTLVDATITNTNFEHLHFEEILLFGVLNHNACLSAAANANTLIVIEEDLNRFLLSCCETNWRELANNKNVHFLVGQQAQLADITTLYQQANLNLIDTYLFQPYFTAGHKKLTKEVLEIIQSTNGKSNHFEAKLNQLTRSYQNTADYLVSYQHSSPAQNAPIFVVGNGPSLDAEIASLIALRGKVTVVSCGTALATLLKNSVIPDYHVELEKEADTLNRLNNLPKDILKQINLIACFDVHPAIPKLFKQALLNATTTNPLFDLWYDAHEMAAPQLTYSYYTVTNFAVELLLQSGCKHIYLLGVDFGFPSIDAHHASSSSYFNAQGQSAYDYELRHGATFKVAANIGSDCLTVPAFNAARLLMEQCIAAKAGNAELFNVGSGAKISGTLPLQRLPDSLSICHPAVSLTQCYCHLPQLDSKNTLNHLLDSAYQFNQQLLALWTTALHSQHKPDDTLATLTRQEQLLASIKIASPLTFELFDGSCRYLSMFCLRYAKTKQATELLPEFATHWFSLLQHYQQTLQIAPGQRTYSAT